MLFLTHSLTHCFSVNGLVCLSVFLNVGAVEMQFYRAGLQVLQAFYRLRHHVGVGERN